MPEVNDFSAIRIFLASPEQIRSWSYGEVTKPETINYRTLKPEKDGLFCERIFGPTKDFECYCGKYKRIRYKGVKCDRCGVEVARSSVRRERMGHIELAAPVSHIWFVRGTPSRLALLLDISPRNLERVLYFSHYIVTEVNEEARRQALTRLEEERESLRERYRQAQEKLRAEAPEDIQEREAALAREEEEAEQALETRKEGLQELHPLMLLPEDRHREVRDHHGDVFKAGMGAEAALDILHNLNLGELREKLREEIQSSSSQRRKKAIKRLRVVEAFRRSGNKPEWMVLTVLPVLPPELRPMVQLDGGRFATSDLNDLYRRVINRNNRLKRLLELGAPGIIIRNEKRMLQEAVDSLIDNGRRGRPIVGNRNHRLKSLSDMLRGKQGRFRQNLLGKRVDYSGRSVIVVGPELKLHQCGLPKRMAVELFKPFIMHKLVVKGLAHNMKSAKRMVERVRPEVWDVLEEVTQDRPILLNRAPTLHRLGIQAFLPILVEGNAIQVHPLVCAAFNADFDGDQMAVHVPLSRAAVEEAKKVMLSTYNMLSPASGEPLVAPTLDIVMGCYYLTTARPGAKGEGSIFASFDEARLAYDLGFVDLQARVKGRDGKTKGTLVETTVGRIIFNQAMPQDMDFVNQAMDKKVLKDLVNSIYTRMENKETAEILDRIKGLGFHYACQSGITIATSDIQVPQGRAQLYQEAEQRLAEEERHYQDGLITEEERYHSVVDVWDETVKKVTKLIEDNLDSYGSIYLMATSGAKGNITQIRQMAGMRGLMSDPSGRIIGLPIRSSFIEGLSVLEYFISTHGARKGLADTALRTADSGYLTRRLVDVAQDVVVSREDCGTTNGIWVEEPPAGLMWSLAGRVVGRLAASPIADPSTGEVLVDRNEEIDEEKVKRITAAGVKRLNVRSPLACEARDGVCAYCYGRSPARGRLITVGEAVGIVAAQSIGEPGTQLTMRTFHTGGVAGIDITSGLPRVEEIFEARTPKNLAILSEIDGEVEIQRNGDERRLRVVSQEEYRDEYTVSPDLQLVVQSGQRVEAGTPLALPAGVVPEAKPPAQALVARLSGIVEIKGKTLAIRYREEEVRDYPVAPAARILVGARARVHAGQKLTEGPIDPQSLLRILGRDAIHQYIVDEVQKVYRAHGVTINDKHIEVIVRQMLRKVRVDSQGDTDLLPEELKDRFLFEDINRRVLAEGGEPATAHTVLLGVTKASLNTESFLAAASFQETTRVLTEAAIKGAKDRLFGLKENVIIGKLIPARSLKWESPPVLVTPAFLMGGEEKEEDKGEGERLFPEASTLLDSL